MTGQLNVERITIDVWPSTLNLQLRQRTDDPRQRSGSRGAASRAA
jgi:hypothetical protein